MSDCKNLADNGVILRDGSSAGDWRLPTVKELESLVDFGQYNPALPAGNPFTSVQNHRYWTSYTYSTAANCAWYVWMLQGIVEVDFKADLYYVWPVRGGEQKPGGVAQPVSRFTPLGRPRAEAQDEIKDSYAFSDGVNAPCESLLTGFTENGDGTVTDNLTRLIWLKNANHFGEKTWEQAMSDCKNLADDGVTLRDGSSAGDWRLPTEKELVSLVDYGQYDPALPAGHPFIGVQVWRYWASDKYATAPNVAYYVEFVDGYVNVEQVGDLYYAWPVRDGGVELGGVTRPKPRFTDNGDGTVTDNLTRLSWLKNANCFGERTWEQAMSDCKNLTDNGVDLKDGSSAGDWRLPTVQELESLNDYSRFGPCLPAIHPFTGVQNRRYWSSTSYASTGTCGAWIVSMRNGGAFGDPTAEMRYVWPVRGSKSK